MAKPKATANPPANGPEISSGKKPRTIDQAAEPQLGVIEVHGEHRSRSLRIPTDGKDVAAHAADHTGEGILPFPGLDESCRFEYQHGRAVAKVLGRCVERQFDLQIAR